jgi:hypothetical protein
VDAGAAGKDKDYYHQSRGKAPDLGAIELGDAWQFPRPGPRWAQGTEIANRPKAPNVKLDLWKPNIPRLNHAVRVDGSLDEWGQPALTLAGPSDVGDPAPGMKCGRWNGPDDMSVKVYWGHDGEALCVAAKVTDDRHVNKQTGDMIWNGDALQMLVGQCNMALALTEAGVVFHQFSPPDGKLRDKAEYKVVRDEKTKTTVYELRLPLAALGLEPGAEFDFNIVFLDDDDGKGHRYWLQLAPGLCGRPAANPRYILAK